DRIGVLPPSDAAPVWQALPTDVGDAEGVLALLALLVTAPAVAAFHAARNVPGDVSAATLADLGQQTRVHRLVNGRFGLGTYTWEAGYVWSGALYRLGRLQLSLERHPTVDGTGEEWVLSTHIPRGAGLAPADVEASLAAAPAFFAEHFPDVPAQGVHCHSWMLDPRLPELLPGSNLAAFQQRWRTYGEPAVGDQDALFFGFARPGRADRTTLTELLAQTSLQRAILEVWRAGDSWHVVDGRLAA
ncbi:MAG: acyltransferase domain-containing protein, partial [Janthinobacterium lividum]